MADWLQLVSSATRLPGVEEAVSYGEPSLKVRKSLLTRWRRGDNSLVLLDVDPFERERLLADEPDVYFLEPHYEKHEIVLARLARLGLPAAEMFLERRWRNVAPKRLITQHDTPTQPD